MNFLGSPPFHFPETKRLDASFPALLREENAWRKVNEEFGLCLKEIDKEAVIYDNEPEIFLSQPNESVSSSRSWSQRIKCLQVELTHQIAAVKKHLQRRECYLLKQRHVTMKIIELAKTSPLLAADVVHARKEGMSSRRWWRRGRLHCVAGNPACNQPALPFSKYCLTHITLDEHQKLYRRCVAVNSCSTLALVCGEPVYNILLEKPLCSKHAAMEPEKRKLQTAKSRVKGPTTGKSAIKTKQSPVSNKLSPNKTIGKDSKTKRSDVSDTPLLPHIAPPTLSLPLLTPVNPRDSTIPSLSSSSWSSAESDGEGEPKLLADPDDDPLIDFPSADIPPPPLLPISLLPLDPTLRGDILDNASSSD